MASHTLEKFYKPYLSDESDEETDDETSSESSNESDQSSMESVQSVATTGAGGGGGGPAAISGIRKGDPVPPATLNTLSAPLDYNQTKTTFKSVSNTTTIMINSRDRDTNVFGQPTFFTIRLPRMYRNVVSINVTQIKLLSSFYYFSNAKNNTSLRVAEYGRVKTVNGQSVPNTKDIFIREGTYDSDTLVSELNNQLNRTPIYNRISFSDFIAGFITTGDYGLLFNDPGDTTFNPLTGVFETLTAKTEIVSRYFQTGTNVGIQYYTTNQCKVAYYYPMLRDYTISQVKIVTPAIVNPYLNTCTTFTVSGEKSYTSLNYMLDSSGNNQYLNGDNYYDRIVYSFTGLDDPYILSLVSDTSNQALLEQYKADNTWDNFLVNQYVCNYDSTIGRLTVYSKQLNTSLVTTLNTQYQYIFTKELINNGIEPTQVSGLQTTSENLNGVIADMYNFIQLGFTNLFGISYGSYAAAFYKTLSNELFLYDASGRYGWALTYTGLPQKDSSVVTYPDASGYWQNLKFNTASGEYVDGDLYYSSPSSSSRKTVSIGLTPSDLQPANATTSSYTFTVATGLGFAPNNSVVVISTVNTENRFNAIVDTYNSVTGVLVLKSFSSINGNFYDTNVLYTIATNEVTTTIAPELVNPALTLVSIIVDTGLSLTHGNSVFVTQELGTFEGKVNTYNSVNGALSINTITNITGTWTNYAIYTVYASENTQIIDTITKSVTINVGATTLSPVVGGTISFGLSPGLSLNGGDNVSVSDGTNSFSGTMVSYSITTGFTIVGSISSIVGTGFGTPSVYILTSGSNVSVINWFNYKANQTMYVKSGSLDPVSGNPTGQFIGKVDTYNPTNGALTIKSITNIRGLFAASTTYVVDHYIRYTYTIPVKTDLQGYIDISGANETTYGYQDISFNVIPTAYTKVKFTSRCRQTMFIETIPPYAGEIPRAPRLPETYYLDLSNTPLLFDSKGACLLDPESSDFYLYDISQNMLDGPGYMQKEVDEGQIFLRFIRQQKPTPTPNQVPPPRSLTVYTFRPHIFFQIKHNLYPIPTTDTKFTSDIYIEREDSQAFGTQIEAYWYRDRAAYMADAQYILNNVNYHNPKNWFIHKTIAADISSAVITTDFISDETSYLMIRASEQQFTSINLRVFVLRHNPSGIYTLPVPTDYRRLPAVQVDDPNYFQTKPTPATNFPNPYPTLFNSNGFRNSYDLNGVSNNLLDYTILSSDFSHYDPYSFSNTTTLQQTPLRFTFQLQTPAIGPPRDVSAWSQYFFSGSKNVVYDTSGQSVYYNSTTAALEIANKVLPYTGISNEYVFTNWFRAGAPTNLYSGGAVPPPEQTITPLPDVSGSPWSIFSPITYNSTYPNYTLYKQSPFVVCKNIGTGLVTDISYNNINSPTIQLGVGTNLGLQTDNTVLVKNGSVGQFNGIVFSYTGTALFINNISNVSGSFTSTATYTITVVDNDITTTQLITPVNGGSVTLTLKINLRLRAGNSVLVKNGSVGQFNGTVVSYNVSNGTLVINSISSISGSFGAAAAYTVTITNTGSAAGALINPLNGSPSVQQIYLGPDAQGGGDTFTSIIGIPFTPTMGKYVLPTRVVLKFSYVQPLTNALRNFIGRNSGLTLTGATTYVYNAYSTPAAYLGSSQLAYWDDHYYLNRRNVVLGVFKSRDINGQALSSIKINNALCTLTLKKVTQVCQYSTNIDPTVNYTKGRTPDWGTYYVYERNQSTANLWIPLRQDISGSTLATASLQTKWTAVSKGADGGSNIFMKNYSSAEDLGAYYSDVSNNSLCFVPFYPVFTAAEAAAYSTGLPFSKPTTDAGSWAVGTLNGLTYTSQPYIPITQASVLSESPNIINPATTVCIDDVSASGGGGISIGENSTYMGSCGPLCWGVAGGIVKSPNYRRAGYKPTYFNIRVNIRMSEQFYNPMTDLTVFGTATDISNCLIDTQTYFYDLAQKPNSDFNDISGAWGQEKAVRFIRFDNDSGYNNLSYMPSLFITPDTPFAVNIRGYVPTVSFLSGIRISGKNWTDFGQTSLLNLINEIDDITGAGIDILPDGRLSNDAIRIGKFYTSNYTRALLVFNKLFIGTFTGVGRGYTNASYAGETFTSTGFGDYINRFINYNNQIATSSTGISTAQSAALTSVRNYITEAYSGILPPYVLQRNRYTDPLTFSLQFYTQLKSNDFLRNYLLSYDQWGLGWNLGFDKVDTPYTTRHVATTFIRIVEDYIYFKLNDELNINNVDISEKEDLSQSRETFGSSRRYYGKLLLNTFGNFAQTFIQPAKSMPFPIGKVDKLTIQLVDAYNNKISNNDCEYNVVFEITEMVDSIEAGSAVTRGVKS